MTVRLCPNRTGICLHLLLSSMSQASTRYIVAEIRPSVCVCWNQSSVPDNRGSSRNEHGTRSTDRKNVPTGRQKSRRKPVSRRNCGALSKVSWARPVRETAKEPSIFSTVLGLLQWEGWGCSSVDCGWRCSVDAAWCSCVIRRVRALYHWRGPMAWTSTFVIAA